MPAKWWPACARGSTELQPTLPEGIRIETFYDRGDLVTRAVDTVSKSLIEAVLLVLVLLVAFLGNLRAAVAVALILPLSALSTFLLMRLFGVSANLMSLGGLAIAIGMLVDARWSWSRTSSPGWPCRSRHGRAPS